MAFPAGRLEPGVFFLDVEMLIRRLRTGVLEVGFSDPRMAPAGGRAVLVVVPGVVDELLNAGLGVLRIDWMNLCQITSENRTAAELEALNVRETVRGQVAVAEIIFKSATDAGQSR